MNMFAVSSIIFSAITGLLGYAFCKYRRSRIGKDNYYEHEIEKLKIKLMKSEKMAEIGTLATGIAHEFNNILQIANSYVEFAMKTNNKEDIDEALKMSLSTSERASKIIKNMLTFSMFGPGTRELCRIEAELDSILFFVSNQLKISNIMVLRKYSRIPEIAVNKEEIRQVFLNMILNARDSITDGGKIEIATKQTGKEIEVIFKDTGKGIEKGNLERIFEPFYTTKDSAKNDSISGTGLGLFVCNIIVKAHGGKIEVASEVGKGTQFTIRLPLKQQTGQVICPKPENKNQEVSRKNILVIDDEENIGRIIHRFLSERHAVKYVTARDSAIGLMANEKFDMILMDVMMPGMTCLDALDKINGISAGIKIILMSGKHLENEALRAFKEKRVCGFLQKPFTMEEVLDIVN